jgi:type VI secretion system protein ImpB
MDGKTGAEELIARTINDPALLQSLVSAPNPAAKKGEGEAEE